MVCRIGDMIEKDEQRKGRARAKTSVYLERRDMVMLEKKFQRSWYRQFRGELEIICV